MLFLSTACWFQGQANWRKECCPLLAKTGIRLLLISDHNQDKDQNRSEWHCHILAWWFSTLTFDLLHLLQIGIYHKNLHAFANWKNTWDIYINLDLTELISLGDSNIFISVLLSEISHCSCWWISEFVINKHHSWQLFSASCVYFSGETGTSMLSISGFDEPNCAQVAHSLTWNWYNDEHWDPNKLNLHWCWFQCWLDPGIRMRHTYVNEMPPHNTESCIHGHLEAELFK